MKKLLLALFLLICLSAYSQKEEGIHQGMVRVQGTVAIGFDINKYTPEQRYYIYGEGEYLVSDHVGVNGSVWANVGSSVQRLHPFGGGDLQEETYLHSILAGPVFHAFSNRPLDLYAGIQPGFSLVFGKYVSPLDGIMTDFQVSPTATVHGGVAYYGSFFHVFAQARYVRTQLLSLNSNMRLNDLRLCIGLGFNFF